MRINRKTTGTIAMWFVNLSNQWKRRNRKLLWCLCFAFPKGGTVLYAKQYISLEPSYSIQAGAQRFPNSRLLPHLLFDKKGLFPLLWNLYYNATSPSALGGQLLTMQVMTSHNIQQSFFVLALPLPVENNTLKERKQKKKGTQWYCKAQLFTSHQAERFQRHNMSQHAKQCKLEHLGFPETKQRREQRGNFPVRPEQNCDSLPIPHAHSW